MDERYGAINDVVGIAILNEGMRFLENEETTQPLFQYEMKETIENGDFVGATQHIFVVKLGQELRKQYPNLHHWLNFFIDGKVDKDAPQYLKGALDMLAKKTWSTEEEKILAQARADDEKVQDYIESAAWLARKEGRQQGLEEGREEGREEGVLTTAKSFLEAGADIKFVSKVTKISVEDLTKLL
jgi:predicted transposase/invertase (TIGR01784 family)